MVIQRAAYLAVCEDCGQHAHITLPDGSHSHEFLTQPQGMREIGRLLVAHKIAKDEADVLKSQVADSALPDSDIGLLNLLEAAQATHGGDVTFVEFEEDEQTADEPPQEQRTVH